MINKKPKVLVGDDQIGVVGSPSYKAFNGNYGTLADYEFTPNPNECIRMAKEGNYAALIIDLRWGPDMPTEGYRVLEETKDYAPIRILHTSENAENRERGYEHGATHCLAKGAVPEELEKILITK